MRSGGGKNSLPAWTACRCGTPRPPLSPQLLEGVYSFILGCVVESRTLEPVLHLDAIFALAWAALRLRAAVAGATSARAEQAKKQSEEPAAGPPLPSRAPTLAHRIVSAAGPCLRCCLPGGPRRRGAPPRGQAGWWKPALQGEGRVLPQSWRGPWRGSTAALARKEAPSRSRPEGQGQGQR